MKQVFTGWVLAGGAGRRLGAAKGTLRLQGSALVSRAVRCLRAAGVPAGVLGPDSLAAVLRRDGLQGIRVLPDAHPGRGPLPALHAALLSSHTPWILVVACDFPLLSPRLLRALMERARNSAADAVLPVSARGRLQPLCGLYRRRVVGTVTACLRRGDLRMFGLVERLRCEPVHWAALARAGCRADALMNVNGPKEWKQAQRRAGDWSADGAWGG